MVSNVPYQKVWAVSDLLSDANSVWAKLWKHIIGCRHPPSMNILVPTLLSSMSEHLKTLLLIELRQKDKTLNWIKYEDLRDWMRETMWMKSNRYGRKGCGGIKKRTLILIHCLTGSQKSCWRLWVMSLNSGVLVMMLSAEFWTNRSFWERPNKRKFQ